jgi:hypothetical protein
MFPENARGTLIDLLDDMGSIGMVLAGVPSVATSLEVEDWSTQ